MVQLALNLIPVFLYGDVQTPELTSQMIVTSIIEFLIAYVISAIPLMKIFQKAGIESWYAWVPILNTYMLTKIACGNGWLFLIALIPCVGSLIFIIFLAIKLSKAFGYGGGMIALLILLTIIGYYVIGFGSSQYQGPQ